MMDYFDGFDRSRLPERITNHHRGIPPLSAGGTPSAVPPLCFRGVRQHVESLARACARNTWNDTDYVPSDGTALGENLTTMALLNVVNHAS